MQSAGGPGSLPSPGEVTAWQRRAAPRPARSGEERRGLGGRAGGPGRAAAAPWARRGGPDRAGAGARGRCRARAGERGPGAPSVPPGALGSGSGRISIAPVKVWNFGRQGAPRWPER